MSYVSPEPLVNSSFLYNLDEKQLVSILHSCSPSLFYEQYPLPSLWSTKTNPH